MTRVRSQRQRKKKKKMYIYIYIYIARYDLITGGWRDTDKLTGFFTTLVANAREDDVDTGLCP
jgi:hypothetical protein